MPWQFGYGKESPTALMVSPGFPPGLMYVTSPHYLACSPLSYPRKVFIPVRSVDTPLVNKPCEATAREPPRSTIE